MVFSPRLASDEESLGVRPLTLRSMSVLTSLYLYYLSLVGCSEKGVKLIGWGY